jgi:hypothetical protein
METQGRPIEFFCAGGTLPPNAPSYIKRPADDELLEQIMAGQFCSVLTSRQRGKSSLMIRTVGRLREADIKSAIVDLSGLGTEVSQSQWYLGMIVSISTALRLSIDPRHWWSERTAFGPVQCFIDFLHDVVLAQVTDRVVIFFDEIDSTLKIDFSDDFFAAIRLTYNLRATDPEYDRLTFVLLGVAAPTDLIKDRNRTPFNIGVAIDLQELSRSDAQPFQESLDVLCHGQGKQILDRVFHWTNGHPYLTQMICSEIVKPSDRSWSDKRIDTLVERLFLTEDARKESNLQFVRSSIETSPDRRSLLHLYRQVYMGEQVPEDERSPLQKRLGLIGLVCVENNALRVRNEIYRRVFDLEWIKASTPRNWMLIASTTTILIAAVALIVAIAFMRQRWEQNVAEQVAFSSAQFERSSDPDVKMSYLATICGLGREQEAQKLFYAQSLEQQLALFHQVQAKEAGDTLTRIVGCIYPSVTQTFGQNEHAKALAKAMSCALYRSGRPDSDVLREQIDYNGVCDTGE